VIGPLLTDSLSFGYGIYLLRTGNEQNLAFTVPVVAMPIMIQLCNE
jgi:hypothetical protein